MPELYVITGPNGAGKSSNALGLLPAGLSLPVFDGDKIYYQLLNKYYQECKVLKYAKEKAASELELIFLEQVDLSMKLQKSYAYEGHFTNENSWSVIRRFRENGYKIVMIYLALENVALSLQRVATRVSQNGHHVPPLNVYDNFFGNIAMLDKNLALINRLIVLDNGGPCYVHILTIDEQQVSYKSENEIPQWLRNNMPNLLHILTN
ncbi:zeta toxin family protein [Dyadobacter sp. CY323]|uniref:zeta toxin family protein n=1 Tax=Dyadobacter sp. CY323 TaxID=2907302 RepID=UPI001F017F19|nr:zeta toxin family protein [Dyadobacter sp. CY323]MCE6991750.1 zeta toxin family protein [Dyadobacter sp. CY323]